MLPRKMLIDNIECLQNELDSTDFWKIKRPQTKSYSWSQLRSPQIFCRMDYTDMHEHQITCKTL